MSALAWNESTWNNDEGFGGITTAEVTLTGVGATTTIGSAGVGHDQGEHYSKRS